MTVVTMYMDKSMHDHCNNVHG